MERGIYSEKFCNFVATKHYTDLLMTTANIIRFTILGILWLLLVGYLVSHAKLTLYLIFVIVASAIIIFVPVYKKYVKNNK